MSEPVPLIIDTDPALGLFHEGRPRDVDDAFAIAEAIGAPDVDLRGITVTFGNAPLAPAHAIAQEAVSLAGVDVPVAAGEAGPIPPEGMPSETGATRLLRELLLAGPARIAALGPLGNIATFLLRHPQLAARIEEVVIVGGRTLDTPFYLGDVGPVRDFNFESDVRAARVLLESGIPVVCAGFELSSPIAMTAAHLDAVAAHDTPLSRWLEAGARDWLAHWTESFPFDEGFHPWDSAALCWIRSPELITTERRGWRIREVEVTPTAGNPDDSPDVVSWLETGPDLPGSVTFCTGFVPGGAERFLAGVVEHSR